MVSNSKLSTPESELIPSSALAAKPEVGLAAAKSDTSSDKVVENSPLLSESPDSAQSLNVNASVASNDSLQWSELAYDLGLQGLVLEIAVNSIVESFEQNKLKLRLKPEMLDLVNPANQNEISQAIAARLGVSLSLEMAAHSELEVETPREAKVRHQEEQRQAEIKAIKEEPVVKKLHRILGAELVESSVTKINQ